MRSTRWAAVVASVLVLLAIGCRGPEPVYNVSTTPVVTSKPASLDEVQRAIQRAAIATGWQTIPRGPGNLEGITTWATHRAVVDIKFDTKTFSITYKDSDNLNYDGTKIHPFYNTKIQDFDKAIRRELNLIGL